VLIVGRRNEEEIAMEAIYTARATATGDGRNGHTASEDGLLDVDVRIPKEMGGPGGATNPEELFAAGYAACFHSALKLVGGREKVDVTGTEVTASVSIGSLPGGAFGLGVELSVHAPNLDHDTAQSLVEKAHEVCPYSNATRGNIEVALSVV
jgi:osmotically inducible protein OsmC